VGAGNLGNTEVLSTAVVLFANVGFVYESLWIESEFLLRHCCLPADLMCCVYPLFLLLLVRGPCMLCIFTGALYTYLQLHVCSSILMEAVYIRTLDESLYLIVVLAFSKRVFQS
jgi:hypothetical protein